MWSCALCLTSPFHSFSLSRTLTESLIESLLELDWCLHHLFCDIDTASRYNITYSRYVVSKNRQNCDFWSCLLRISFPFWLYLLTEKKKDRPSTLICRHVQETVFPRDVVAPYGQQHHGRPNWWLQENKRAEFGTLPQAEDTRGTLT